MFGNRCRVVGSSVVVLCSLGLSGSAASAAIVTPSSGVGADTFVQNGSTTNNSTGGDLTIKFTGTDTETTNRKAYVRFDTSTLPAPGTIGSATLALTVSINNGGGTGPTAITPQNFTFNVYGPAAGGGKLGEDWDPTTITYANAPANNTASGSTATTGTTTANAGPPPCWGRSA
jgi:hypothetical protein